MKKLFYLILPVLLCCCKSTVKIEPITITSNDVKDIVSYLASDDLKGRNTGTDGIDTSATYIETQFKAYGVKPYFETYRDNFKVDTLDAFNVVGYLEGNDDKLKHEFIILGAHYDHIGYGKLIEGDSIANGANDNAAGTSAVMTIAKYLAHMKNNKRSIMFALFSAEEKGLKGSKHLAQRLKAEKIDLYTMVNFEMVGVPFKDRDYEAFVTGYDMSNMAEKINAYTESNLIGKSDVAVKYNLFKRSDNYPFYLEFKVPSQTISSCDMSNFDYYHHVDDEVDKLDFNFMASLINKTIPAIENMSNTPTKEIRITNE
ncbi:M20/M25/M40 family metallo-hydrolase [Hyunsoonleella flava]|uniref:M20/M25/M40 family metallo-hydrolase n=1 Tax=Hyunsoonleella flava TaxID=2527939 RepID=A0A4Q9FGL8_9FLAO|nr:M20/M25/M40 family metallo-hydrolase [Hyunsoonleella flava]TBN01316.1 M20/M25/M40 family metallo-hydrolase [Hyunsoonleella flava]